MKDWVHQMRQKRGTWMVSRSFFASLLRAEAREGKEMCLALLSNVLFPSLLATCPGLCYVVFINTKAKWGWINLHFHKKISWVKVAFSTSKPLTSPWARQRYCRSISVLNHYLDERTKCGKNDTWKMAGNFFRSLYCQDDKDLTVFGTLFWEAIIKSRNNIHPWGRMFCLPCPKIWVWG